MEFAVAMLVIAAFMLVTGVVGHDTEMGGRLTLKVTGKVGPIPRMLLVVTSAVTLVLSIFAFVMVQPGTDPGSGPPAADSVTAASAVDYALQVGIRPALGQVEETMELSLDGRQVASWTSTQDEPARTFALRAAPGVHSYRLTGSYSYVDPGGSVQVHPAKGEGTITLAPGTTLGILFIGGSEFQVKVLS